MMTECSSAAAFTANSSIESTKVAIEEDFAATHTRIREELIVVCNSSAGCR
jgi:hypothetical protein